MGAIRAKTPPAAPPAVWAPAALLPAARAVSARAAAVRTAASWTPAAWAAAQAALRLKVVAPPPPPPACELRVSGRRHSRARDQAVIAGHYDLSAAFYQLILDPSMAYSCAYWPKGNQTATLADAQRAKLDMEKERDGFPAQGHMARNRHRPNVLGESDHLSATALDRLLTRKGGSQTRAVAVPRKEAVLQQNPPSSGRSHPAFQAVSRGPVDPCGTQ